MKSEITKEMIPHIILEGNRLKTHQDRTNISKQLEVIPIVIERAVKLVEDKDELEYVYSFIKNKYKNQGSLDCRTNTAEWDDWVKIDKHKKLFSKYFMDGENHKDQYFILRDMFKLVIADLLENKAISQEKIDQIVAFESVKNTHLSIKDSARKLMIEESEVKELIKEGVLKSIDIKRNTAITNESIKEYAEYIKSDSIEIGTAIALLGKGVMEFLNLFKASKIDYVYHDRTSSFSIRKSSVEALLSGKSKEKPPVQPESEPESEVETETLGLSEAAEYLGVTTDKIKMLEKEGILENQGKGRQHKITIESIDIYQEALKEAQ